MIIIELTYKVSLDEVNSLLEDHRSFLSRYYDEGIFIASGPKVPRDGGIILALVDLAAAYEILKKDPFFQHGIAEYKLIEFEPAKYSDDFRRALAGRDVDT